MKARYLFMFCLSATLVACDDGSDPADPGDGGVDAEGAEELFGPAQQRWVGPAEAPDEGQCGGGEQHG